MKHPHADNGTEYADLGISMMFNGGAKDGEVFKCVKRPDGAAVYVSQSRPGEFKQVLVPVEFQSPQIV